MQGVAARSCPAGLTLKGALPPVIAPTGALPVGPRAAGAVFGAHGRRRAMDNGVSASWRARVLEAAGVAAGEACWLPLQGGHVNRVWRVDTRQGSLAVKLYSPRKTLGLFPNLPEAEFAALSAGCRADRTPHPLALSTTEQGTVLVYRYVHASTPVCPKQAGEMLAKLHRAPPWPGLPVMRSDRWHAPRGTLARLSRHGVSSDARAAIRRAAKIARMLRYAPVPVHGDPVPANMLAAAKGPVLIDWQCPARGEAATDLALFLSAAMHTRYGTGPLTSAQARGFRRAYGIKRTLARYDDIAPALHARIAMHCLVHDDHTALKAEIALLNRLGQAGR